MTYSHSANAEPAINPALVQQAHDATRWTWFRDRCTPEQMHALVEAAEGTAHPGERREKINQIADAFIAQGILRASAAPAASGARGWMMDMNGTRFEWQPDPEQSQHS